MEVTWRRLAIYGIAALAFACIGPADPSHAQRLIDGPGAGPTSVALDGAFSIPGVLSNADAHAYIQALALQERGDIPRAAEIITDIENPVLMGYLQAQKYLHPTAHRSSFNELRDWLTINADHPQAERIYRLALRRQPDGATQPRRPMENAPPPVFGRDHDRQDIVTTRPGLSDSDSRRARDISRDIVRRVGRGWPTGAREILDGSDAASLLSQSQRDAALREIARGYFRAAMFGDALAVADLASLDAVENAPLAHWWGGLAAWRLDRMADAQRHFSALAGSTTASRWVVSAGSYWAARAYLAGRQPDKVNYWLNIGAAYPYTFYGLLSRRALGYPLNYNWSLPQIRADLMGQILATPHGRRAVALMQVGFTREAEIELTSVAGNHRNLATTVMALAARADMPALTKRLSGADREAAPVPAAMYPVPPWRPDGGFSVDRALIFAFIRQESAFREDAQSHAGARGLMQLMPSTASFVSGDRSLRGNGRDRLFEPGYNMSLGQRYLTDLMNRSGVGPDLFKLAIAYNAGPGNLDRWFAEAGQPRDSLLFIESIPSRETRIFVERILANFWIYRDRLGQPTPSLSATAGGGWPTLVGLDSRATSVAELVRPELGFGNDRQ